MKIIPLSEGSFTVDATKKFIPFQLTADEMKDRAGGSLLVEIQPFVIVTDSDVLLCDTGLGFADGDGQLQLVKNLAKEGLQTGDITKVLLSHLHKDHAGGLVYRETKKPVFENAAYYIQERELAFAREKGFPSYDWAHIEAITGNNRLQLLQDDAGIIDGYIRYQVTQAHSKYHQVFWVTQAGETVFFGSDDAPQYQQMKHRFAAKYDFDGKKAMELRSGWWEQGKAENWAFLFYHDINTPVYRAAASLAS